MKTVSIKLVNFLTLVLSTVFFMFTGFEVVFLQIQENKIKLEFNELLSDIQVFNYNHLKGTSGNLIESPVQNELFKNGTDAFLFAYHHFMNANTYHVIARGKMVNSVLGITILTDSKNTMIKFEDGSMIYELTAYEKGNAYGRTGSQLIYYDKLKEKVYTNFTTSVNKVNDDLVPIYESSWRYRSVSEFIEATGIVPGADIFDHSKRTIVEETYFNKTIISGKVKEYQTQIISNPILAGKPYTKIIAYVAETSTLPIINYMKANAIIGEDGQLKHMNLIERFDLKTKIPVLGDRTVSCESDLIYHFIHIGGINTVEKPNVSNSNPW